MFTEEIASFVTELSCQQLSPAVIGAGKVAILDCAGVTLAGAKEIP